MAAGKRNRGPSQAAYLLHPPAIQLFNVEQSLVCKSSEAKSMQLTAFLEVRLFVSQESVMEHFYWRINSDAGCLNESLVFLIVWEKD